MQCNPFLPNKWVSINVAPHGLSMIGSKRNKQAYLIEQAILIGFKENIFLDNKIKRWDILSSYLIDQVEAYGLQGLPTIVNLPANAVRMEKIQLPKGLSDKAIEAEICRYVQRDLNKRNEPLAIDFSLLPSSSSSVIEVYFAVARQEYIDHLSDCIKTARLNLKIVDVDIYCLKRLVATSQSLYACIHISKQGITLLVCNLKEVLFYQQWKLHSQSGLIASIEEHLAMCYAILGKISIEEWFIDCTEKIFLEVIKAAFLFQKKVERLCLLRLFTLASNVDKDFFSLHAEDFSIACGSVRRMVPVW